MSLIYLNGEYKPIEEASINVLDRGFIFGDGIYEVIPIFNRKIFRFSEHMIRLENSLREIYMSNPLKENEWRDVFHKLIDSLEQANQSITNRVARHLTRCLRHFYQEEYRTQFSSNSDGQKQECEEHLRVQKNLNTRQFELFSKFLTKESKYLERK